jgi:hypothetical protein
VCEKPQELSVPQEKGAQPLGNGEGDHPVGNLRKKMLPQPLAPENKTLRLAAGAEHSSATTESHREFAPAILTDDPGEAILENAALQKPGDGPLHHAAKGTIPPLELVLIEHNKALEVVLEKTVEGRPLRIARTIDPREVFLRTHSRGHVIAGVSRIGAKRSR